MVSLGIVKSLIVGAIIYCVYAWLTFNPSLKQSGYLVPAGITLAMAGNLLWIFLAKSTADPARLTIYAMAWDTMVTVSFVLVPVVLFGIRFSITSCLGLILAVLGIFLMKIGSV